MDIAAAHAWAQRLLAAGLGLNTAGVCCVSVLPGAWRLLAVLVLECGVVLLGMSIGIQSSVQTAEQIEPDATGDAPHA